MSDAIELPPRTLNFAAATSGGVLLAMAAHVVLARQGIDVGGTWRELFVSAAAELRSALAWWLVGATAFLGGLAIAALGARAPVKDPRFRWFAWLLVALAVAGLAAVGHIAAMPTGLPAAAQAATDLAVIFSATLLAMLGALAVLRR